MGFRTSLKITFIWLFLFTILWIAYYAMGSHDPIMNPIWGDKIVFSSAPELSGVIQQEISKTWTWLPVKTATSTSSSNTEEDIQKVFKIQTYAKNEDGSYMNYSYWSAILVRDNQILTNAHVIMGENDLPSWKYNLCISKIDTEEPICVSSLRLIKYDRTKDIALLETNTEVFLWKPLELRDRKLTLGEVVKVYGYPSNGGSTLSFTEWKMSGKDKWYYKIDANIDRWNSGWWAFDKDDIFIGMPYIAEKWLTTMGYIIPVSMINDFLADVWDITRYMADTTDFESYIQDNNDLIKRQEIQNPFFTFDWFKEMGFTLEEISGDTKNGYAWYTLYSSTQNTRIAITVPSRQWNTFFPYIGDNKDIKDEFKNVDVKLDYEESWKKINQSIIISGLKKSNGTIDSNVVIYVYELAGIRYMITSKANNGERKDVENAVKLFKNNFTILKKNDPQPISGIISVYSWSFIIPNSSYVTKHCKDKCSYGIIMNNLISSDLSIYSLESEKIAGISFDEFFPEVKKIMWLDKEKEGVIVEQRINKLGQRYIFIRKINTDESITIVALFYWKDNNYTVLQYSFSLDLETTNTEEENHFADMINTFRLDLKDPFSQSDKSIAWNQDAMSVWEESTNINPSSLIDTPEMESIENNNTTISSNSGKQPQELITTSYKETTSNLIMIPTTIPKSHL